jgi:excisionase family DNA binding protein
MTETLLRTHEVAELLRVHPKHVYRLLKKGLPARRVGGEWRFSRNDVLAWSGGGETLSSSTSGTSTLAESAPPSIVAANGDVVVRLLLELSAQLGPPLVGFVQSDNRTAAELLEKGMVLAAGAHAGGFPSHLGKERVARLHLVMREVGLMGRQGSKPPELKDLNRQRLASRAPSAGVRAYLDQALKKAGLSPEKIHRRAVILDSHLDVVCAVAAGRVDVGLGSRAWGERAGLSFTPLATEAYGLIVKARDLGDPRVVRLCEVAQSTDFHSRISEVAGYDPVGAGDIRYDA